MRATETKTTRKPRPLFVAASDNDEDDDKGDKVETAKIPAGTAVVSSSKEGGNDGVDYENPPGCWNPNLRLVMGSVGAVGMLETAYLSYGKIVRNVFDPSSSSSSSLLFCDSSSSAASSSSCSSVLDGPYAYLPGTEIPISLLGFIAYSAVTYLALNPVLQQQQKQQEQETSAAGTGAAVVVDREDDDDDVRNRMFLHAATTSMGIFSAFLMAFLFGVLHQSCPYCIFSAILSFSLASLSWFGGVLPSTTDEDGAVATTKTTSNDNFKGDGTQRRPEGTDGESRIKLPSIQLPTIGAASVSLALSALLLLNVGGDAGNGATAAVNVAGELAGQTTLQQQQAQEQGSRPPTITTASSEEALRLGADMNRLHSRMYGAYWCSHCYDQKQALGREVMERYVPYVECSKDGYQSQTKLCRSNKIPGYPTWEINGQYYPGERSIEELRELVDMELVIQQQEQQGGGGTSAIVK